MADIKNSVTATATATATEKEDERALCLKQFREFLSEYSDEVDARGACVFIGDIHGQVKKLAELWGKLEASISGRISRAAWEHATIVFMGDYADKKSNTKDTMEWLSSTIRGLSPAGQQRIFLMGNHDHSLMCFLNLIPDAPPTKERMELCEICRYVKMGGSIWCPLTPGDAEIEKTLPAYSQSKKYSAKLSPEKVENIFLSYGCAPGDTEGLRAKIPQSHVAFLMGLRMVEILHIPGRGYAICTHGGIINDMPVLPQINSLLTSPDSDIVPQLSCKMDFSTEAPKEAIADDIVFVSGHHKVLHFSPSRIIVDTGNPKGPAPISAVIIPPKSYLDTQSESDGNSNGSSGTSSSSTTPSSSSLSSSSSSSSSNGPHNAYGLSKENICYGLFVEESSEV